MRRGKRRGEGEKEEEEEVGCSETPYSLQEGKFVNCSYEF